MNKEVKSVLKKTVKIAGVTCVALGGAALIASGAALKAMTEGARYLKETVRKIAGEPDIIVKEEEISEETPAAEVAAEAPAVEAVAEEADFAEEA